LKKKGDFPGSLELCENVHPAKEIFLKFFFIFFSPKLSSGSFYEKKPEKSGRKLLKLGSFIPFFA